MKITTDCGNCGSQNRWLSHHVRLRGVNRRLCTCCVLRLHPSSFCPSCFQFYDSSSSSPHPSNRFTCVKCSSISHSHCVLNPSSSDSNPLSSSPSSSSYLCPPCAKPNFSFFDLDSKPVSSGKSIDKKMAVVLLCAAKIAAASMGKAVIVAKADAERKVREATVARKRAREALEHVGFVIAREKARRKEEVSVGVSGSGNVGIIKEKERNRNAGCVVKVENSCEGSVVANTHTGSGLTQRRESLNGFVRQMSMVKNEVAVAIEEVGGKKNVEVDSLQSNKTVMDEKEKSGKIGDSENGNGEVEHVQHDHIGGKSDAK